jgi:DcmR-like sensory protein
VRFYKDADSLCRIVGGFLAEGVRSAQPAIVIATPLHRAGITDCLAGQSIDVAALERAGELLMLDADEMLARFMVDGMPDPALFRDAIVPAIQKAGGSRTGRVVRAYGEMVDVLWKAGQTVAATRLEMLWNDLAGSQSFSLLCGYAMGSFYKDAAVEEVCSHHSHVMSESGEAVYVN